MMKKMTVLAAVASLAYADGEVKKDDGEAEKEKEPTGHAACVDDFTREAIDVLVKANAKLKTAKPLK